MFDLIHFLLKPLEFIKVVLSFV